MRHDVFRSRAILSSALVLILAAGAAHAAKNLMRVRAEVADSLAVRGSAVFTECVFANASHMNTVESTLTASVRFADGSEVVTLASETHEFAPGDAFIFRSAVVVEEDAALGTAVWACRAESTIVGGPRPQGQMGVDSAAATFDVLDAVQ